MRVTTCAWRTAVGRPAGFAGNVQRHGTRPSKPHPAQHPSAPNINLHPSPFSQSGHEGFELVRGGGWRHSLAHGLQAIRLWRGFRSVYAHRDRQRSVAHQLRLSRAEAMMGAGLAPPRGPRSLLLTRLRSALRATPSLRAASALRLSHLGLPSRTRLARHASARVLGRAGRLTSKKDVPDANASMDEWYTPRQPPTATARPPPRARHVFSLPPEQAHVHFTGVSACVV